MVTKTRSESHELKLLKALSLRTQLSSKEQIYFQNLQKGFQGEVAFDQLTDHLQYDWLIINDLLLDVNNTFIQIDKLALSNKKVYIFEVKNFTGDFTIEETRWISTSKAEIKNPINQLDRSASCFRRLINELGFSLPIESYVVFINPEFHLYNAPINMPIIYPTQLNRFIKQICIDTKVNEKTHQLAQKLLALHVDVSPYSKLPTYSYEQLYKGLLCLECGSVLHETNDYRFVTCYNCGFKQNREEGILRGITELRLLFPNLTITKSVVYDWCKNISARYIQKVLAKHFQMKKSSRSTYYE